MPKFLLTRIETYEAEIECETYEEALDKLDQQEWGSMSPEIKDWVDHVEET